MRNYVRWLLLAGIVAVLCGAGINFSSRAVGAAQKAAQKGDSKGTKPPPKAKPTPDMSADPDEATENDPDRPAFARGLVNEAEYLRRRQEADNIKLGMTPGQPFDAAIRQRAIAEVEAQEVNIRASAQQGRITPYISNSGWTNIGPYPLPNGQTEGIESPVSGRVTAIAIHPTNPDIVYVGLAQGGVFRSLNGGQTWTPIFDSAQSLVIGALALAPSNPEILYVGTGEANLCGSGCYAGIGVYRIESASTTATLFGPINPSVTTGTTTQVTFNAFMGRAISRIIVKPDDPATIFVATTSGVIGNPNSIPGGNAVPPNALRGLFRSTNATAAPASVAFTKLTVTAQPGGFDVPSTGNRSITDIAFDPADATSNTVIAWVLATTAASDGGAYRATDALTAGTFTQTLATTISNARGSFALNRVGSVTTVILGSAETGVLAGCTGASQGVLRRSVDGGATWSAKLPGGSGYCGGQCFYDQPVAIHPTNANTIYVGGNVTGSCSRLVGKSTDGAATAFTPTSTGIHGDNHVIALAPSNPNIIYTGTDGGIWRSNDAGSTWLDLNNRTFVATQFQSLALHPTDRNFLIGGTQDNGTEFLQPNPNSLPFDGWKRADFGDGGYARIDQTATDTTNVTMYHTYFNQTNAMGYARVTNTSQANEGQWTFFGCGFSGSIPNGLVCTGVTATLFYAPLELGPTGVVGATGNTVYFGSDRLYRSMDQGTTMVTASQIPIVANGPISSIGISPTDDNVRIVGIGSSSATGLPLATNVFATTTGSLTLTNVTPAGSTAAVVNRVRIDPNNHFTAYVCYGGQNIPAGQHIWKTTNLDAATPTWTVAGNGIPDVPVDSLAIDPNNSNILYAGTDVGVFISIDGAATWNSFNVGLPRIAIFDMAIQNANRILRVATHGRGIWEIGLAPSISISGTVTGTTGVTLTLTGSVATPQTTVTDGSGNYTFTGLAVGGNYTVTPSKAGFTFTPPVRTLLDLPNSQAGVNFTAAATGAATPVNVGDVIISEFRLRGTNGAADEFVELYNNTNANITVNDPSGGWALDGPVGGTRVNVAVVPNGTVLPARGHYLLAANGYSLAARAAADFYYTPVGGTDVDDNTGLALYSTATRASFSLANRLDAAGFTGAAGPDREGTGLAPLGAAASGEYSFVRNMALTGLPQDTGDNAANFAFISTTGGAFGRVGAVGAADGPSLLGTPGPENLASPLQRNSGIRASALDPTVSSSAAPNRVRDSSANAVGANRAFGTLTLRRTFTNNTGQAVTRLRFRVVDITTLNSPGGPLADVRFIDGADQAVTTSAGTIGVLGVRLPQSPAQALGGGLNATGDIDLVGNFGGALTSTVAGTCPATFNCSVDVQFVLGVQQTGTYRFFINIEALP